MSYTAIIFDMDGTIVDTEKVWQAATTHLIKKYAGYACDEQMAEIRRSICGSSLLTSCTIIKEQFDLTASVDELMTEKFFLASTLIQKEARLMDGFHEFHDKVKSLNLPTAIATNATDETLRVTDQTLNLRSFFGSHMYTASDVNNRIKPDPAVYVHAAEKLGQDPRTCIAIEDSAPGIAAARAAGMFCIGINTSNIPGQTALADLKIDRYDEIDLDALLQRGR